MSQGSPREGSNFGGSLDSLLTLFPFSVQAHKAVMPGSQVFSTQRQRRNGLQKAMRAEVCQCSLAAEGPSNLENNEGITDEAMFIYTV